MMPAQVLRIPQAFEVVRPHVEDDREGAVRADAADQGVEGQLADGDGQPPGPLVSDAEDALAVRDDDDVHLTVGPVPEKLGNRVAERIGDEHPSRAPVDVTELLAGLCHHRGVDDGCHLLHVLEQQPVEEHLVGVLQGTQVDVPLQVVALPLVGTIGPAHLLGEGFQLGREEPVEAEPDPLLLGEGGALVEQLVVQQVHSGQLVGCHVSDLRRTSSPVA
jgi:hypothetical protein